MSRRGNAGTELIRQVGDLAEDRWRALKRDAARPWREGAEGDAAEIGRWLGAGLAAAAKAIGIGAALYVVFNRRR